MSADAAATSSSEPEAEGPSAARLLGIYLRQHATASRGGLGLFQRAATSQHPSARPELTALAREIEQDRLALLGILDRLDISRNRVGEQGLVWAERFGRLKPNGTVLRRSPLSDLVELEAMGVAVQAKKLGWVTLRALSDHDQRLHAEQLDPLIERAGDQQERLETLRLQAVTRAFRSAPAASG